MKKAIKKVAKKSRKSNYPFVLGRAMSRLTDLTLGHRDLCERFQDIHARIKRCGQTQETHQKQIMDICRRLKNIESTAMATGAMRIN